MSAENISKKSTLYILCDARAECLRMAAIIVLKNVWKDKKTHYFLARHSNVGDVLLHHIKPKPNDDILIVVPLIDLNQENNVSNALKNFIENKVNFYWYHGPKWFDQIESVSKLVTRVCKKEEETTPRSSEAVFAENPFYRNDGVIETNYFTSYIDYNLMYYFMGKHSAELTYTKIISALSGCKEQLAIKTALSSREDKSTIISALSKCEEKSFKFNGTEKVNVARYNEAKPSMAGRSAIFEQFKNEILELAMLDEAVLIVGETGTGKEATAFFLHEFSPRRDKQFYPVNCAIYSGELLRSELFGHVKGSFSGAIGNKIGLVESIDGGTLFLDEIPHASEQVQAMLLTFIETGYYSPVGSNIRKKVNVKILAGAQPGLLIDVLKDLQLRLFEQIHTYSLCELNSNYQKNQDGLPDIVSMARNLAAGMIGKTKISSERSKDDNTAPLLVTHEDIVAFWAETGRSDISDLLTSYNWPGNVRELQNCIFRRLRRNIDFVDIVPQPKSTSASSKKSQGEIVDFVLCSEPQKNIPDTLIPVATAPVSFTGITEVEELITLHELHNLYAEHVRKIISEATPKQKLNKLAETLGISKNTYTNFINKEVRKERQHKGTKSDSAKITKSPSDIKTSKTEAR